jgi:hypothetical protein
MKIIFKIIKRIIFAFGMIYTLDLVLNGLNVFVPINVATLLTGTILGPLGVLSLYLISFIVK